MHHSLKMYFLVNPKIDQVRQNELIKLLNEESYDSEDEQGVWTKPRRSKRIRVEKSFGPKFLTYLLENEPQIMKKLELFKETFMEKSN